MQTEHYGTLITDLGNGIYSLSCKPAVYSMFEIAGVLPVGETAEWGEWIALCGTEALSFRLTVPFPSRVLRINQALIDYTQAYKGQDFDKYGGFLQTDWIVEVQKIDKVETENTFYFNYRSEPLQHTWYRRTTSYLDFEIGFELNGFCAREMYFKNFQLLGTDFKKNEPIASFEYCPKYLFLAYQNQETVSEILEKHKKLAYLYAPCDTNSIALPLEMYEAIYHSADWLLWHCKLAPMLKIKRTFYAYKDDAHLFWYQVEGEYIRIGLHTKGYEYIEGHGYLPYNFPEVGKILQAHDPPKNESVFFNFVVNGPYDPEAYAPFDLEIISQNPKNEQYEATVKNAICWDNEKLIYRNTFSEANFFEESWLFVARPLYPEKVKSYLDKLLAKGEII
ncbi:MAG: hypothetical protein EAZ57_01005 [Cytophagales bacterium]|nr:MAG: hypothetical protein EAZ67_00125 [Cytophagales bacterium]TAF62363.1 MAG: hypothetical protein EAZ57_01005 [Cytophagales bacterium]